MQSNETIFVLMLLWEFILYSMQKCTLKKKE